MSMGKSIYSEQYRNLVSKVRKAREQTNLTQKEVADALGVTQSFISKIESGQYRIDVIQLSKLAQIYKKKISYFLK